MRTKQQRDHRAGRPVGRLRNAIAIFAIAGVLALAALPGPFALQGVFGFDAEPPSPEVQQLIERPLELLGNTRASVEGVLGPAAEMEMGLHPNRYRNGATDTLYRLRYPGLDVKVYEALSGGRELKQLVVQVTLLRSDRRFSDLLLGASRREIVARLGAPSTETTDFLEYRLGAPEDESAYSVGLELRSGRLSRMIWTYPID